MIRRSTFLFLAVVVTTACTSPSPGASGVRPSGASRNFIVMVEGRNFLFVHEGEPTRFGFSTTRNVSAKNASEAEEIVIRRIREDETLNEHLLNSAEDPPRVTVTHATEVEAFPASSAADPGYIFYRDRDTR